MSAPDAPPRMTLDALIDLAIECGWNLHLDGRNLVARQAYAARVHSVYLPGYTMADAAEWLRRNRRRPERD